MVNASLEPGPGTPRRPGSCDRRPHLAVELRGEVGVEQVHVVLAGDDLDDRVAAEVLQRLASGASTAPSR